MGMKSHYTKMSITNGLLFGLSLLFICEAAVVDNLNKCSIKDDECIRSSYQETVLVKYAKTGIPEYEVPPLEPLHVTNISVTVFETLTITIPEGVIKGISNCVYKKFSVDIEKSSGYQEISCDVLHFKGEFLVSGSGDVVRTLIGQNKLTGHGKIKVKLEKAYISFVFPFKPEKRDDGEIYMSVGSKGIKHKYDIGKATFTAKNVFINNNKEDLGDLLNGLLNQNWKSILKTAEAPILDKIKEIYFMIVKQFYKFIPTKNIILEDLTPYVKN